MAFSRAKPKNREAIEQAQSSGRLTVLLQSTVSAIRPGSVELEQEGRSISLPNDAVIISAGGILPTPFLRSLGVEVQTKFGTA
jgi:NADH dehydrogenase FAD-containing subunit